MEAKPLTTIAVNGVHIVYRAVGKGRPLVVLNGFGAMSKDRFCKVN
jgi:hypothetical protein